MKPKSAKERFEMKFVKGTKKECWEWLAAKSHYGYGKLMVDTKTKKFERAHRLSYMYYVGEIPDGMIVRHKCDNPSCVNPHHLVLGTHSENIQDAVKRKRLKNRLTPAGELNGNSKVTKEQIDEIRELKKGGLPTQRISELFGITPGHVNKICRYESWGKPELRGQSSYLNNQLSQGVGDARRKVTPEMESAIKELSLNGKTHRQIAEAVGLTQGHVSVVLQRLNGGKKQKPRLSQETIDSILRLRSTGMSFAKIGQELEIPKPTVQTVIKRHSV